MKILITAGGTKEKIDAVRTISNMSTGELSSLIAKSFKDLIQDLEIIYISADNSIVPTFPIRNIKVHDVNSLKNAMCEVLTNEKIDVVIHAMAVSDYLVKRVTTAENLAVSITESLNLNMNEDLKNPKILYEKVLEFLVNNNSSIDNSKKISSNFDNLIISMKRSPKLIGMVKRLQPNTILVGFKLLEQVEENYLIEVGKKMLEKNECDFVLANDLYNISKDNHVGYLINKDSSYSKFYTKQTIALGIAESVVKKLRECKNV